MGKVWVDITTIDNNTPFMQVRWKATFSGAGDKWFSEAPGLVTDGMSWSAGSTAAWGWYGGHRMNYTDYTCGFQCDVTGIDNGLTPNVYGTHCKDASRSGAGFYDQTVVISGETYYEIDFSLWDGATGKSLYAPYSVMPWAPGDVFVYINVSDINITPDSLTFPASGGQQTFTVTSQNDWWSRVTDGAPSSDVSWVSFTPTAGTSGTTVVTATTQPNTSGALRHCDFIGFLLNVDWDSIHIYQKKESSGGTQNVYLGDDAITEIYLGDTPISGLMLGDDTIY